MSPWLTETRFDVKVPSNISLIWTFFLCHRGRFRFQSVRMTCHIIITTDEDLVSRLYEWRVIFSESKDFESQNKDITLGYTHVHSVLGKTQRDILHPEPLDHVLYDYKTNGNNDTPYFRKQRLSNQSTEDDWRYFDTVHWTIECSSHFRVFEVLGTVVNEVYRVILCFLPFS